MGTVTCDRCRAVCVPTESTTGYGTDPVSGKRHCFDCCGELDRAALARDGKGALYLTNKDGRWRLSNWPGTFWFPLYAEPRKGRHNIAGVRYDVWFGFDGSDWHGVTYGDDTQICRVRRMKGGK